MIILLSLETVLSTMEGDFPNNKIKECVSGMEDRSPNPSILVP